jgi:hypothetical protein
MCWASVSSNLNRISQRIPFICKPPFYLWDVICPHSDRLPALRHNLVAHIKVSHFAPPSPLAGILIAAIHEAGSRSGPHTGVTNPSTILHSQSSRLPPLLMKVGNNPFAVITIPPSSHRVRGGRWRRRIPDMPHPCILSRIPDRATLRRASSTPLTLLRHWRG